MRGSGEEHSGDSQPRPRPGVGGVLTMSFTSSGALGKLPEDSKWFGHRQGASPLGLKAIRNK